MEKFDTPMLLTFPFLTNASRAFHVSIRGTSIISRRQVLSLIGNLSVSFTLLNATGQWIYNSRGEEIV